MIEEVKQIILERLYEEYITISATLSEKQKKLQSLQKEKLALQGNFILLNNEVSLREKFNFLEKIFKKTIYKELPSFIQKRDSNIQETNSVTSKIESIENDPFLEDLRKRLLTLSEQIKKIEKAKTLHDLEIKPIEAIDILESRGITPILTEAENELVSKDSITKNPRDYSTTSSLIAVHKTRFAPKNSVILSPKQANAQKTETVELNGYQYSYSYARGRDTIHFAINGEVSSHMYGNFDDCKYAILIPFDDLEKHQTILQAPSMDTFVKGKVQLTDKTWILCPENEVAQVKRDNPNVHVIGYTSSPFKNSQNNKNNNGALGFSGPFLSQLGYSKESVSMWGWGESYSERNTYTSDYRELMKSKNYSLNPHSYTFFHEDEMLIQEINQVVSLCCLLKENFHEYSQNMNSSDLPNIKIATVPDEKNLFDVLKCFSLLKSNVEFNNQNLIELVNKEKLAQYLIESKQITSTDKDKSLEELFEIFTNFCKNSLTFGHIISHELSTKSNMILSSNEQYSDKEMKKLSQKTDLTLADLDTSKAIKANGLHANLFFGEMENKGFIISDPYKNIIKQLSMRIDLKDVYKNSSAEEKLLIDSLPEDKRDPYYLITNAIYDAVICAIEKEKTATPTQNEKQ